MASTAELLIQVTASTASAVSAISELEQQTRLLEQIMANTATTTTAAAAKTETAQGIWSKFGAELSSVGKIAAGMATGMLVADVTMGIAQRFQQAATQIDTYGQAVLNVQRITGGTAEASSQLVAIFERFSPSVEEATTRATRLQKAFAGQEDLAGVTAPGGKTSGQFLREFGVSSELAASQTTPFLTKLEALAEGFKNSTDAQEKDLAVQTLLGRGSQTMLLLLNQGAAGIDAVAAAAKQYGLELTGENLEDVQKFSFAHHDMDMALQGVSLQLGAVFMPAITTAAQASAKWAQSLNEELIPRLKEIASSPALPTILGVGSAAVLAASAVKVLGVAVAALESPFVMLGAAIYSFSQPLRDAIADLYELKDVYNSLPAEAFNTPVVGGAASAIKDLLNKLPDLSGGSAATEPTTAADSSGTDSVSPGIKAMTADMDARKVELQDLQNAAAERKADFDQSSLADTQKLLDLKSTEVNTNSALLDFKRQIEDIDRNAVDFAQQRLQLEEQRQVLLAQQAESPLKNQSEDITYQENLIKARIAASRAGGPAVDADAMRLQLHNLQLQGRRLDPALLQSEHDVTLAQRSASATDTTANLAKNATDQLKLAITQAMQPAQDAANQAKRALEDQQAVVDLEKQAFDLKEKGFAVELALADAREKGAAAALFRVQHPDAFPAYGPNPVAVPQPTSALPNAEQPDKTFIESHPELWSEKPNQTWDQSHNMQAPVVNVNVGQVGSDMNPDEIWDSLKARFVAAWDAARQGTPIAGAFGGAYNVRSAPR